MPLEQRATGIRVARGSSLQQFVGIRSGGRHANHPSKVNPARRLTSDSRFFLFFWSVGRKSLGNVFLRFAGRPPRPLSARAGRRQGPSRKWRPAEGKTYLISGQKGFRQSLVVCDVVVLAVNHNIDFARLGVSSQAAE